MAEEKKYSAPPSPPIERAPQSFVAAIGWIAAPLILIGLYCTIPGTRWNPISLECASGYLEVSSGTTWYLVPKSETSGEGCATKILSRPRGANSKFRLTVTDEILDRVFFWDGREVWLQDGPTRRFPYEQYVNGDPNQKKDYITAYQFVNMKTDQPVLVAVTAE